MVGSIDPRCETVRGTHWPVKVAGVFVTRVAENHLGHRPKRRASSARPYGCKRSDQTLKKTLAARGPSTYGPRLGSVPLARCAASGARYLPNRASYLSSQSIMTPPASALPVEAPPAFLGVAQSVTGKLWRDRLDARGAARALALVQRYQLAEMRARVLGGRGVG